MSTGGEDTWIGEAVTAFTTVLVTLGGVFGWSRRRQSKETPPTTDKSQRSSGRGLTTLRLETSREAIHKLEERLTRNSKLLFERTGTMEKALSKLNSFEKDIERIEERLISAEATVSDHKAEIAVLRALIDMDRRSTT